MNASQPHPEDRAVQALFERLGAVLERVRLPAGGLHVDDGCGQRRCALQEHRDA